jgi:hypothetical protein
MDTVEHERLLAGRYRLSSVIGRGGMGTVWHARDELLGRDVAIKEIIWPPSLSDDERRTARHRALREAQMAARLRHPNVVLIYDIFEEDDRPWIVMELLPYRSLRDIVAQDGPLPPHQAAGLGLGILAALGAAHAEGIVHRDVKPANILVGPEGRAVLTDFGIARPADSPTLTASGLVIGSPSYIAPERARGERAGPAADLWGLGACLYTAVEGRPPFEREGALATLTAVVADEPDPATHAEALWPLISGLLRKDPASRLGPAQTGRMLRQLAADGGGLPRGPGPWPPGPMAAGPEAPGRPARESPVSEAPVPEPFAAEWVERIAPQAPVRPAEAAPQSLAPVFPGSARRRSDRTLSMLVAIAAVIAAAAGTMVALTMSGSPGHKATPPSARPRPGASAASVSAPASRSGAATSPAGSTTSPSGSTISPSGSTISPSGGATSPSAAPSAASSSPASAADGTLPAGYYRFTNPTGFSVGVPQGWPVSHVGHYVYLRDPANSGVYLLIDQSDHPKPDPLTDWQQQEANRETTYAGYHRIRLESVEYPQAVKAADWEFTYYSNGVLIHVLNRNILANAHHAYALYWTTPQRDWDADYHYFQVFAATFRPAAP